MGRGKRQSAERGTQPPLSDGERSSHRPPPRATRHLTVQVNGKVKVRFQAPMGLSEEEIAGQALAVLVAAEADLDVDIDPERLQRTIVSKRVVNLVFDKP